MRTTEQSVRIVGADGTHCIVHGLPTQADVLLELFDGRTPMSQVRRVAQQAQLDRIQLAELCTDLSTRGLLTQVRQVTPRHSNVVLFGPNRVGEQLSALIPIAQHGGQLPARRGLSQQWLPVLELARQLTADSDLTVLELRYAYPDPAEVAFAEELAILRTPVLVTGAGTAWGRVGPYLPAHPSPTGCLRCEQLALIDADPNWNQVSEDLAEHDSGVDRVMAALVAAQVARTIRSLAESEPEVRDSTFGHVVEMGGSGDAFRRRRLPHHRGCGCWWANRSPS